MFPASLSFWPVWKTITGKQHPKRRFKGSCTRTCAVRTTDSTLMQKHVRMQGGKAGAFTVAASWIDIGECVREHLQSRNNEIFLLREEKKQVCCEGTESLEISHTPKHTRHGPPTPHSSCSLSSKSNYNNWPQRLLRCIQVYSPSLQSVSSHFEACITMESK